MNLQNSEVAVEICETKRKGPGSPITISIFILAPLHPHDYDRLNEQTNQ